MSGRAEGSRLLRPHAPEAGKIDPKVIRQAADWWARLRDGATPADRAHFERWRQALPAHDLAWQRLVALTQGVSQGVQQAGAGVASRALQQAPLIRSRRNAIRWMVAAAGVGVGTWVASDREALRGLAADLRTGTGERRSLVLEDGTHLQLNTATAVDLRFSAGERRIVLREGEILVATAADALGRPLVVESPAGTLVPLGTRFTVRHVADEADCSPTRLAVIEGAVRIYADGRPDGETALVMAGQQARFTRKRIHAPAPLDEAGHSWVDGTFSAEGMRLADLLADLGRYRPGRLRCAPQVADLRITGAWPLDGPDATDRILDALARRLPVRVSRYTRYWVTVGPR